MGTRSTRASDVSRCIDQLRRDVEEIRCRDSRRLVDAERELAVAEAELASLGARPVCQRQAMRPPSDSTAEVTRPRR
jgi:hypothetical protein